MKITQFRMSKIILEMAWVRKSRNSRAAKNMQFRNSMPMPDTDFSCLVLGRCRTLPSVLSPQPAEDRDENLPRIRGFLLFYFFCKTLFYVFLYIYIFFSLSRLLLTIFASENRMAKAVTDSKPFLN